MNFAAPVRTPPGGIDSPPPSDLGLAREQPKDRRQTVSPLPSPDLSDLQAPASASSEPVEAVEDIEVLDEATSWALVRSQVIGRFAANRPDQGPLVVPVNYVVEADLEIVVRSGAGSKLDLASRNIVTLEVGEVDPIHRVGWSVVIQGLARALYADESHTALDTWAPGWKPYVIRIRPTQISGRRIRLSTPETDDRGYR